MDIYENYNYLSWKPEVDHNEVKQICFNWIFGGNQSSSESSIFHNEEIYPLMVFVWLHFFSLT